MRSHNVVGPRPGSGPSLQLKSISYAKNNRRPFRSTAQPPLSGGQLSGGTLGHCILDLRRGLEGRNKAEDMEATRINYVWNRSTNRSKRPRKKKETTR